MILTITYTNCLVFWTASAEQTLGPPSEIHIFQRHATHVLRASTKNRDQRTCVNRQHIRFPDSNRNTQALTKPMTKLRDERRARLRLVPLRVIYTRLLDRRRHDARIRVPEARTARYSALTGRPIQAAA